MKEKPITSPRPRSQAFIYHQSALLLSLVPSKPGCIYEYSWTLYYFSPHSCFFLPTPANISSFLWITLLYRLVHVISMPRCYLIPQQSSFGVEWAEQQDHRRGGIDGGGKGNKEDEGLKLMLPLASDIEVVLQEAGEQRGWGGNGSRGFIDGRLLNQEPWHLWSTLSGTLSIQKW